MKNTSSIFLSVILLLGLSATPILSFASTTEEKQSVETLETNEAYSHIEKYLGWFKNGTMAIGITSVEGVKSQLGNSYTSSDEKVITVEKDFSGYTFSAKWGFEDGLLDYFELNTFYDETNLDQAARESKEILDLMKSMFGESQEYIDGFHDWTYLNSEISCNLFDDGYSIYVDPPFLESDDDYSYGEDLEEEMDMSCVGDFYNLKKDLQDIFLKNFKIGLIKIGHTTKPQMEALVGNGESFYQEYDGLWAMTTFSYDESGKLNWFTIDYFYDNCGGALILLDADKGDITSLINEELGVSGMSDSPDDIDATIRWSFDGVSLSQMGFEDGYSVTFGD